MRLPRQPFSVALKKLFHWLTEPLAFAWLDRAYVQRDDGLIFTKVEPLLKSLHNDPRFTGLLKKLNLQT